MDSKEIGKFIAKIRKEKGMTQQKLAEKLFVTDKAVSKWERGLSLPDISILEKLAKELDVSINEILEAKKENNKNIIQEEINKEIEKIEQKRKNKKKKLITRLLIAGGVLIFLTIISIFIINDYQKYHPKLIKIGENNYRFINYVLEKKGLNELEKIIKKSESATDMYNVSYLKIKVNKKGKLEKFTLSINYFDSHQNYVGRGGYTYNDKKLIYSYTSKDDENSLLVETYSKNNNITYISNQIKKIPLRKQIKVSELKHYFITYRPNTTLEWGTSIFDATNQQKIKVLSKNDYNNGVGGQSQKGNYFVIKLNDGSSDFSGQQYLYVFDSIDENVASNPNYMMETDYYINNGKLQFTRDYGNTWIKADITEEQLKKTLDFYNDISLKPNSWFLSTNELIPIAYFYGEEPILKISFDNGETWMSHEFIKSSDIYGKKLTRRVVGFTSQNFGYVALGTDWSMGSGEIKKLYFTYDGGKTWNEVSIPLNGTSHVLYDVCMYDENIGVILLRDTLNASFPIVYSTISGGKSWNEVRYRDANLPDEITYLSDVDTITKDGNAYYIKLGQGNNGTLKAIFRTSDMQGFQYVNKTNENIHTVG